MSRANVELVRRLQPAPDVDLAQLFRNEELAGALMRTLAHVLTDDFECVLHALGPTSYGRGVEALRRAWIDWLEPWETYHATIEEYVDLGDDVFLYVTDSGRRRDTHAPVMSRVASIWSVAGGRISRAQFFAERSDAERVAGL